MRIGVIGGSSEGCECGLGPRHGGERLPEETSSPEPPSAVSDRIWETAGTSQTPGLHGASPLVQGPQETLGSPFCIWAAFGKKERFSGRQTVSKSSSPPLTRCIILGPLRNLPKPLVSYL